MNRIRRPQRSLIFNGKGLIPMDPIGARAA